MCFFEDISLFKTPTTSFLVGLFILNWYSRLPIYGDHIDLILLFFSRTTIIPL